MNTTQTMHTPGPWRVMPCPTHHGKHVFHDHRWIATADAEVERGHDPRPDQWSLSAGTLIAQMRDGEPANAHLIAAAPELLAALELALSRLQSHTAHIESCDMPEETDTAIEQAEAAIQKARGGK